MQEKQKINIIWLRNDLRIKDNPSIVKALQGGLPFFAIYVLDIDFLKKKNFHHSKIGKFRAKFLIQTLENLQNNLAKINIPFILKKGNITSIFKEINAIYDVQKIFLQHEWTAEEKQQEQRIKEELSTVELVYSYGQFLFSPNEVNNILSEIPNVFTNFRKKIENQIDIRTEWDFTKNTTLYTNILPKIKSEKITLQDFNEEEFNIHPNSAFYFSGGEDTAWQRLEHYFFKTQKLSIYKETRNGLIGEDYSTKFSAWLANGSISAVSIYHQIKKYEAEFGANESTYWLFFELIWRDYFKYISLQHGNDVFKKNGIQNKYENHLRADKNIIDEWMKGKTKSSFVNANMLELKNTGWMSNRGRQNVASYFCKTLKQDWRIGAAYFEKMLIDYDVHSNYGNWMYVSGVGNDPRNRTFNPEKQAMMYDENGSFRQLWNF